MGDTVEIRTTPTITIFDYTKGMVLPTQNPEPSVLELAIDKGKGWNFIADDVDKFQSDYDFIEDWTRDASEQMKIEIDTDILGAIYADAHASNAGATAGLKTSSINLGVSGAPITLTKSNILEFIVDMGTVLDEQSVPQSDRWLILPPKHIALIKKSDLKDASLAGDGTSILRNGRVGMIDRFMIYNSNLLATTTDGGTVTNIIAGHKSGLTFASQLLENESLRAESTFGTIFRGLQVFGYKVVKPESIVHGYAI
ncbi:MAG: hypothetical protein KAS93_07935 [Gammaproteobacteria bacterium]|nr:hypothetical protein [Gammaproteobacteria bacterium]